MEPLTVELVALLGEAAFSSSINTMKMGAYHRVSLARGTAAMHPPISPLDDKQLDARTKLQCKQPSASPGDEGNSARVERRRRTRKPLARTLIERVAVLLVAS